MTQSTQEAFAEIRQLFKETNEQFKETDAKFKETDERFKETDARFKETDARLDRRFQESDERFDRRFRQLEGLFGNQWGRLLEALVEPGVLRLFQTRGIPVHSLYRRAIAQVNGNSMEIDLLLENTNEAIAVEVKSQLTVELVNDFLSDLAEFPHFFPKYSHYRLYGAVAGLNIPQDVARYAYRRGLFILSVTGNDMVHILNDEKFIPYDFSAGSPVR
ncbi:MAG: hypothetical protein KF832_27545 [Caldilineaceae bacterium]|nr:hypothetical protein [Caldilineaceae bacterium]